MPMNIFAKNRYGTIYGLILCVTSGMLISCTHQKEQKLPVLGEKDVTATDTVYDTINDRTLVNQDIIIITIETVRGKIYVANLFFPYCRTICPTMKTQMLRVYKSIQHQPNVILVSHTIDPEHDTVAFLND